MTVPWLEGIGQLSARAGEDLKRDDATGWTLVEVGCSVDMVFVNRATTYVLGSG